MNSLIWHFVYYLIIHGLLQEKKYSFFSQFFLATSNTINDSNVYYFEHFLHDVVACLPSTFIIADFVLPLRIIGSSGSTGKVYRPDELSVIDKLVAIRGYCQKNKRYYPTILHTI